MGLRFGYNEEVWFEKLQKGVLLVDYNFVLGLGFYFFGLLQVIKKKLFDIKFNLLN